MCDMALADLCCGIPQIGGIRRIPSNVIEAAQGFLPGPRRYLAVPGVALLPGLARSKVRYKQTVSGLSWAILQPLMTMVILR